MTHVQICKNALLFFPTKPTVRLLIPSMLSSPRLACSVAHPRLTCSVAGPATTPRPPLPPGPLPRASIYSPEAPRHKYRLFLPRFGRLGDSAYSGGAAATNWGGTDHRFALEQMRLMTLIWRAWGCGMRWAAAVRHGGRSFHLFPPWRAARQWVVARPLGDLLALFLAVPHLLLTTAHHHLHGDRVDAWLKSPVKRFTSLSFRSSRLKWSASPDPRCTPWLLLATLWSAYCFRIA
jgi:hypothetical protein